MLDFSALGSVKPVPFRNIVVWYNVSEMARFCRVTRVAHKCQSSSRDQAHDADITTTPHHVARGVIPQYILKCSLVWCVAAAWCVWSLDEGSRLRATAREPQNPLHGRTATSAASSSVDLSRLRTSADRRRCGTAFSSSPRRLSVDICVRLL